MLKALSMMFGPSGCETEVLDFIKNKITEYGTVKRDILGNLYLYKKGTKFHDKLIAVCAHTDEVGFIISSVTDDGYLKFKVIGGIDKRILPSKKVIVGHNRVNGVIGVKAVHLQNKEERQKAVKTDELYIDIGAESKEEALKLVSVGEYAGFNSNFVEFGNKLIKGKALDDRVGCSILIELLKNEYEYDTCFCFTVQEEVGLRGAEVASKIIKPDLTVVVETTSCFDVIDALPNMYNTVLRKGPAISVLDAASFTTPSLKNYMIKLAQNNGIPYQLKTTTFGGNDSGKFAYFNDGSEIVTLSVPCRYIHSPSCVISSNDYDNTKTLLREFLSSIGGYYGK